jgi:hypothetical protein
MLTHVVDTMRKYGTRPKRKVREWKKVDFTRFPNPGIQRRVKMFEHEDRHIEEPSEIDDEDFDFMELNQMHDLHERLAMTVGKDSYSVYLVW